jgi:hypothetical protein
VRTGVVFRVATVGATKTRTLASSSRYLAEPLVTCTPGAPVRRPPGSVAWPVPARVGRQRVV